jgi:uncharacterized protein YdhG (YjbR/CyaY superfamily)
VPSPKPKNIAEYTSPFPKNVQLRMEQIRATIKKAAPKAEEFISYGIPAFKLKDMLLIYYAGFKNHIGVYPAPTGDPGFKKDFEGYKTSKGTVQFQHKEPLPLQLITKIVKFRIRKNAELAKEKKLKKSAAR